MLLHIETSEFLFLFAWIVTGSILGFFSFSYNHKRLWFVNVSKCIVSIGLGCFLAFPLFYYLFEQKIFSPHLCILISGIGAIGLPDILLKYWPKLSSAVVDFALTKLNKKG